MSDPAERTIAIVCNSLPPYRLHAHERFANEIAGVRLLTLQTHIDATRDWVTSIAPQINVIDFSNGDRRLSGRRREWERGGAIIETLRAQRVDAVVVNGYNDAGRRRIIDWCRGESIACFLWADSNIASDRHSNPPWKRWIKRLAIGPLIRKCTGCFACGRLGRDYWEWYGAEPERVFLSPYEPDYRLVQELPQERIAVIQERLGFDPARRRIVYCGRLIEVKRVDIAIDAFAAIANERPEWDLVIVGDGVLRDELEARVPARLADRVKWTGFLAEPADVSAVYRASDVLALPSSYEPWALVVNESVAAGMAVVATDVVGAAQELVHDGKSGRVVPPDSREAFTEALRDVTAADRIDAMKAASAEALADWRRRGDPVEGLRDALRFAGVLPAEPTAGA
ncbi:MAG: glycosyltransferase family 4 protein [Planctomycetota bacterium]